MVSFVNRKKGEPDVEALDHPVTYRPQTWPPNISKGGYPNTNTPPYKK